MSLQEVSVESEESKIAAGTSVRLTCFGDSDGHAGGHSAICDLCNLSLLDLPIAVRYSGGGY